MQPPNNNIPILVECSRDVFDRYLRDEFPDSKWGKDSYSILPDGNSINIAQIREMKYFLRLKSRDSRLVIFYEFDKATQEAQNSILKTLEEKNENNQFILHIHESKTILPTIFSRCRLIKIKSNKQVQENSSKPTNMTSLLKNDSSTLLNHPNFKPKTVLETKILFDQLLTDLSENILKIDKWDLHVVKLIYKLLPALDRNINPQLAVDWFLLNLTTK